MNRKSDDASSGQPPQGVGALIEAIIEAETEDFAELLKIAQLDPLKDLRYSNWSEADFGDVDVSGWDLSGARLTKAKLSRVRNITAAIFNAETEFDGAELPEGVTPEILIK